MHSNPVHRLIYVEGLDIFVWALQERGEDGTEGGAFNPHLILTTNRKLLQHNEMFSCVHRFTLLVHSMRRWVIHRQVLLDTG